MKILRSIVVLLMASVASHLFGEDYVLGSFVVKVDDKTGLYQIMDGQTLLLEQVGFRSHAPEGLAPGVFQGVQDPATKTVTLRRISGPFFYEENFQVEGNKLTISHKPSCAAADKLGASLDSWVTRTEFEDRIPLAPFLGQPFSFTTVQVKAVAPFTAEAVLVDTDLLKDNAGTTGKRKGSYSISGFAMQTATDKYVVQLRQETQNPYCKTAKTDAIRYLNEFVLGQTEKKPPYKFHSLKFGDALDAATKDNFIIEITKIKPGETVSPATASSASEDNL